MKRRKKAATTELPCQTPEIVIQTRTLPARWQKELPEAMEVLRRGFPAATQFYAFPEPHWGRLRTTNGLERLHGEIKRRIRSAGAFPDRASALRLITAVALRTTEVWSQRRYLTFHSRAIRCTARPGLWYWSTRWQSCRSRWPSPPLRILSSCLIPPNA